MAVRERWGWGEGNTAMRIEKKAESGGKKSLSTCSKTQYMALKTVKGWNVCKSEAGPSHVFIAAAETER